MRVKAFTLIEIIVVILLVGIIYSLLLESFISKDENVYKPNLKDISLNIDEKAIFYIYGENCKKALIKTVYEYIKSSNYGYKKNNKVLKYTNQGDLQEVQFDRRVISNKEEHICFKLDFHNKKFSNKFIVSSENEHLLFLPFFQEIIKFETIEEAIENYRNEELYPKNNDEYYRE